MKPGIKNYQISVTPRLLKAVYRGVGAIYRVTQLATVAISIDYVAELWRLNQVNWLTLAAMIAGAGLSLKLRQLNKVMELVVLEYTQGLASMTPANASGFVWVADGYNPTALIGGLDSRTMTYSEGLQEPITLDIKSTVIGAQRFRVYLDPSDRLVAMTEPVTAATAA